jgi:hypothetical protein
MPLTGEDGGLGMRVIPVGTVGKPREVNAQDIKVNYVDYP